EGRYYIEKYKTFFFKNLGILPYPGTLNIKLLGERDILLRRRIEMLGGTLLKGFTDEERSFGDVWAFQVKIGLPNPKTETYNAFLLKIERTHYNDNILEIVSENNLRKSLNLEDDDLIRIVYIPEKR
ncbi:MAG: DUF120 domain-containing protein, partial [Promethearchaeota archaeon]